MPVGYIGDGSLGLVYVGGYTLGYTGTTSNIDVSLTGLTGGVDTRPRAGDIVIVGFATGDAMVSDNRDLVISGYTEIAELWSNDTYDTNLVLAYKVMTSTPDTSVTISGGTLSSSAAGAVAVHVWRNINSTPLDVSAVSKTTIDTALPSFNPITTITENSVVICCGAGAHTNGTKTFTASQLSNFITSGYNDNYDVTIGMGSFLLLSGTFFPDSWSFSGSDSSSNSNASIVIALRPNPQTFGIYTLNTINIEDADFYKLQHPLLLIPFLK